ncbi:MAG: protein-L-isoaspartate O-methyltransferase [Ignavibacteria bacterium GWB2_35_6b]|nr:MAG: protein-L-isoaspartate O-methyltransferase [Ignavibacteria bacterium GWB2_35_6b]
MFEIEREALVETIKRKGIKDENVLNAFLNVERHLFVEDIMKRHSYTDVALPIGHGQTISQPYTVAYMTEALNLKPGSKVLEIGTGSGYQAAILEKMGMRVFSIERNHNLYNRALTLFDKLGIRAALRCADGTIGWEEYAPYDGIIVTAGGPTVPVKLKKQLAVGGKMVIPVGNKTSQSMKILTKISEEEFDIQDMPQFTFVPLIGKEGWKEK